MRCLNTLLICCCVLLITTTTHARTWTTTDGETIEGKYVRVDGESLILLTGEMEVSYMLADFSEADQEFVKFKLSLKPGQLSNAVPDTKVRVWKDLAGNQVLARFVELQGDMVIFRDRNDIDAAKPLYELIDTDKTYIANLLVIQKKTKTVPQPGELPFPKDLSKEPVTPDNTTTQQPTQTPADNPTTTPPTEIVDTNTSTPTAPPVTQEPSLAPGQASYTRRSRTGSRRGSSSPASTPAPTQTPVAQEESFSGTMIFAALIIGGFVFFLTRRPTPGA